MVAQHEDIQDEDPRILQASREYLADLEAGRLPDRARYFTRYPALAAELAECFDGIDLAQTLRPIVPAAIAEPGVTPLGDFQIVKEIGRGGMGVVYEAVQLSLGRRVALKVLPFAAALDARQLQRFKTEAQAAAQLHHQHIVPVYGVGCDRGIHFYAMQLIEGRSLSDVIRELRRESGNPEPLSGGSTTVDYDSQIDRVPTAVLRTTQHSGRAREVFRSAARLAADVADALEYAHEAGVVHRDIKPANLLIDARGAVWITDFGLAHVVADAGLTQTGDLVGTLRYMSPEQAAGRRAPIDHRADVYSLGATLYELLTLQPLFAGPDRARLLNQILNEEPRPLRQWDRAIPLELETIVLKALSKNPADRYATAGAMAADLRRFLDEIPILARRPTIVDRTRKWMRRHPSVVASTVLLLVCGVLGLSVATAVVYHQQSLTSAAYQRESQRATEAEERFELAQSAADEMIRLAEEDLSDNPFQEGLRKRLLETALQYYQEFIRERESDPAAQAQLALTRDRVQKILADLATLQFERQGFLLRVSEVIDDLGLTEDQRQRVNELMAQIDAEIGSLPEGLRPDEFHQQIIAHARAHEKVLSKILTAAERKRLRQIALQWAGPRALLELDVQRALKLTSDQKHEIHRIEMEFMHGGDRRRGGRQPGGPRGEHPGGGSRPHPGGPRDDGPPRDGPRHPDGPWPNEFTRERLKAALEKIDAALTPEQRELWNEMTGPPYAGPISFPGRERGKPRT